ncbi:GNAT family N-acetyltransferase [Planctomicrobium piriforme]|uniref:Amino-acid N-acetyltransferase n=1 Tax=Planctomicrobium piriforme TaxID=1576369 RepID=A0A1I3S8U1_9PLAN|nr:GNAT family N-acetyltransferase [Planctomicrobium piriforme]SFJ54029.1 amino-acid N-acetyltransferase [Planctomicrobium piriforme]
MASTENGSDPDQIIVRAALADDADDVLEFLEKFVEARRILPRTLDELTVLMPTGYVAVLDGRIVGFAALEIYSKKLAEIRSLCVEPSFQGRGVGKQLTRACVDLAAERNIFEVMVITSSDEFFRGCGFDFTLPGEKKALFLQTREHH